MRIKVDAASETPLYKQIVDEVCRSLNEGVLKNGEKMPTVRELADELGIARGTIKHAYTELCGLGIIEMTQGRGTFVKYEEQRDIKSKKERAMRAIDALLDDMEDMSFTLREIQIFFDLKLREREGDAETIEIAVIGESTEEISSICDALSKYQGVRIKRMYLDDILCSPERIDNDTDIIVTDQRDVSKLHRAVLDYTRVIGICLETSRDTVAKLARIKETDRVAIIAFSKHGLDMIESAYEEIAEFEPSTDVALFSNTNSVKRALSSSDTVIIPSCCKTLCGANMKAVLDDYSSKGGRIVEFLRSPDGGSMIALDVRIQNVKDSLKSAIPY